MRQLESRSFVGRAAEMAALQEMLTVAAGGHAAMALIGGEAGVGKTRLVAELAGRAREDAASVAVGACVELTAGTAPYLAVTEVLRDLGRVLPDRVWERLRASAGDELAALLPGAGAAGGDVRADDASRARLFGSMHDLLVDAAATAPLVLVLEDVHWADRSTLDLTGFLARTLRDERILVVATYRSDEVSRRPALREWLAELGRVERVRRLNLSPFTVSEVTALLAAILGAAPDARTAASIAHRSGGNAFLAEELLAAAREGDEEALPASVRDVLDARIAALDSGAQDALRAAAVVGARVDDELLAAVVATDLSGSLRDLIAHHMLVPDRRDGRLNFRHELLREAAYGELLPGERRRLHAACARVLTERPELGGDAPATTAAAVAGHWHAAGEATSALVASLRAAEAAERMHALAEAAALYEQVLALWDQVDAAERLAARPRLAVLERAAAVLLQSGGAPRAIELLDEALELADPVADPVGTGVLHSRRAWTAWAAGVAGQDTYEHHEAALRLIPAEPPTPERAHAVADLAFTEMLNGQHHAAVERGREAVALARRIGDRRIECLGLTGMGSSLAMLGASDEAIESLEAAVAIARADGMPEELGRAYVNLTAALDASGRLEESAAVARDGEIACNRLGLARLWGAFLTGNAIEALIWLGRWDEAEALLAAVPMGEIAGTTSGMHLTLQGARLAFYRGDLDACEAALDSARAIGVQGHTLEISAGAALVIADLTIARGRPEEGLAAIRAELESPHDDDRLVAALVAAGVAAEAARPRPGEEALARARELIARLDHLGAGAQLDVTVAEAATARAELTRLTAPDPALWRDAADAWELRPAPYQVAHARWREAEALLATGASRAAAAAPLRAAAATARELRAAYLLREIELLAARARIDLTEAPPPVAEPDDEAGLTPREREILAYLAAGRTNRQIADALFISPRTAGVHVSRILAKLGASTRGEAAAAGRLAGLIEEETLENLMRLTPPRELGGAP